MVDSATHLVAPHLMATPAQPRDADAELVARAQAGDREAMQEIYRRHADVVFRRLTRLVGSGPDREDLLQQVFVELFRGLHRFRGDARFGTYLYRIATNIACDHLQQRRRRQRRFCSCDDPDRRAATGTSPELATIHRQQLERAWSLLDRIKPKKRVAFVLRVVEGLSMEQIAEQVGARPATVAKRVMHAQRELMAMMERGAR